VIGANKKEAAVTFDGDNKYKVIELFKGSGPFEARFPDDDTIEIFPNVGPDLIVKVGDTVYRSQDGAIGVFPKVGGDK
jgi:hypothetical protein